MHHRGQLMLIERLLGIVPHLTRERQARMQAKPGPNLASALAWEATALLANTRRDARLDRAQAPHCQDR
jgi:hypothetical protein